MVNTRAATNAGEEKAKRAEGKRPREEPPHRKAEVTRGVRTSKSAKRKPLAVAATAEAPPVRSLDEAVAEAIHTFVWRQPTHGESSDTNNNQTLLSVVASYTKLEMDEDTPRNPERDRPHNRDDQNLWRVMCFLTSGVIQRWELALKALPVDKIHKSPMHLALFGLTDVELALSAAWVAAAGLASPLIGLPKKEASAGESHSCFRLVFEGTRSDHSRYIASLDQAIERACRGDQSPGRCRHYEVSLILKGLVELADGDWVAAKATTATSTEWQWSLHACHRVLSLGLFGLPNRPGGHSSQALLSDRQRALKKIAAAAHATVVKRTQLGKLPNGCTKRGDGESDWKPVKHEASPCDHHQAVPLSTSSVDMWKAEDEETIPLPSEGTDEIVVAALCTASERIARQAVWDGEQRN